MTKYVSRGVLLMGVYFPDTTLDETQSQFSPMISTTASGETVDSDSEEDEDDPERPKASKTAKQEVSRFYKGGPKNEGE